MGWFEKYCEKCGTKVDKKTAPQRFGKYFCSEDHANEFMNLKEVEEAEKRMPEQKSKGGCC